MNKSVCGVLLLSLMACQSPQRHQTVPRDTEQLVGAYTHAPAAQRQVLQWDAYFQDPVLKDLLGQALATNKDLQLASLQILEAQALYGIQRADALPSVNAGMDAQRARTAAGLRLPTYPAVSQQYSASVVCRIGNWICGGALLA